MATITIFPSGLQLVVEPGTTILKAANDLNLGWPSTCGGKAQCTTCTYIVLSGGENFVPSNRLEQHQIAARKGRHAVSQNMRLACQTIIKGHGEATIQKKLMVI